MLFAKSSPIKVLELNVQIHGLIHKNIKIFFKCFCHNFLESWRTILHFKRHICDERCLTSILQSYKNLMISKISIQK